MNSGGCGLPKGLLVGLVSTDLTIGVLKRVMRTISCSVHPWVWSSRMRLMVCAVGMGCPYVRGLDVAEGYGADRDECDAFAEVA